MNVADNAVVFSAAVLNVAPHEGQSRYLLDDHAVKVLVGGRRAGKTFSLAVEIIFAFVTAFRQRKPSRQLLVAPGVDQAKLLLATVSRLLSQSSLGGLVVGEVQSPYPELRLEGGSSIFVRAAAEHGRLLRGHSADRVVVDEAAYLPDDVITEAIMPTLADSGGQLVLASTPTSRGSLFHRLFEQGQLPHPRVRSFRLRSTENPHIDQGFVAAQRESVTTRQWCVEYEGDFADGSETFFRWDHVVRASTGSEKRPALGETYILGWDPAAKRDASGVVIASVRDGHYDVVRIEDLRGSDYVVQVERVAALAREYNSARVVVDATGHGTVLVDLLRREAIATTPFVFTSASKAALMTSLSVLIERGRLRFPPTTTLLDELRNYRVTTSTTGSQQFGVPEARGHDDLVTALALCIHATGPLGTSNGSVDTTLAPFLGCGCEGTLKTPDGDAYTRW